MVGLEEGKGGGCASTAMVLLCSVPGWERCSESALQRGEEWGLSAAAAPQGQGHPQSVQALGGSGPDARAASTDNASTEPADLVLC